MTCHIFCLHSDKSMNSKVERSVHKWQHQCWWMHIEHNQKINSRTFHFLVLSVHCSWIEFFHTVHTEAEQLTAQLYLCDSLDAATILQSWSNIQLKSAVEHSDFCLGIDLVQFAILHHIEYQIWKKSAVSAFDSSVFNEYLCDCDVILCIETEHSSLLLFSQSVNLHLRKKHIQIVTKCGDDENEVNKHTKLSELNANDLHWQCCEDDL